MDEMHWRRIVGRIKRGMKSFLLVPRLHSLIRELQERAEKFQQDHTATVERMQEEMNLIKARMELPDDCYQQFQKWKKETPVPARPLVSVCISTYNRARLLTTRCLPSILQQTYDNLEVIVVGEHCTDETEASVAGLRDPRLQFHNLPWSGEYPEEGRRRWMVAGTFPANHALQVARGDYITHLDDDDEFLPERIAKLVDWARDKNADLVWHPFLWEDNTGQWLVNPAVKLAVNQVTTSSIFYRHWFKNIPWDPLAHLLDEPGDWNLIRKIKALGAVCVRHPEALLRHYREQSRLLPNKAA